MPWLGRREHCIGLLEHFGDWVDFAVGASSTLIDGCVRFVSRRMAFLGWQGRKWVGSKTTGFIRLLLGATNLALILHVVYTVSIELLFDLIKFVLLFLFFAADVRFKLGSKLIECLNFSSELSTNN